MTNQQKHTIKQIEISPERYLSYEEFGKLDGTPVLYFHGWPGLRVETYLFEETAIKYGLRIIAVDRPGYRDSTHIEKREILDWADDMKIFIEKLDLKNPAIIGESGGAPFAYACVYKIPDLIGKVIIVSGIPELAALKKTQMILARLIFSVCSKHQKWAKAFFKKYIGLMIKDPRILMNVSKIIANYEYKIPVNEKLIIESLSRKKDEFKKINYDALFVDSGLYLDSWKIDYNNIKKEITIWHGKKDKIVPYSSVKDFTKSIPNKKEYVLDTGHYMIVQQADRIFEQI